MNRMTLFLIVPAIVALGACSSGSGSSGPSPTTGTGTGNPPATGGNGTGGNAGGGNAGGGGGDNGGGSGDNGATTQEYDAALTSSSEVPAVGSTATGMAKFTLQQDGVTLAYDITHSVANATAVALHLGYPGEVGAVIHPLSSPSGHMTGNVTLTADEATALTNGQLYVEIQSSAFPSGEVRGTLVTPGSEIFVSKMTGSQVVPPVAVSSEGHASFIMNANKDTVRYHVVTSANPTDVHINRAIGSLKGPVAFPLAQVAPQVDGTLQVSANDATDLEDGHWYLEVLSSAHPDGELRGQVIKEGEILATALLAGINEVPPISNTQATGGAQLIVSADQKTARYEVIVNGIIPTGAEIDNAPQGQRGSMLYPLTLNQTGAKGTVSLTTGDMSTLGTSNLAFNIASASNPNGELRGQIVAR